MIAGEAGVGPSVTALPEPAILGDASQDSR